MEGYSKLGLSGWIVLNLLLAPGDEIVIKSGNLVDHDTPAIVRAVSSNNLLAVDVPSEPDSWLNNSGWLDCMWDVLLRDYPVSRRVSVVRIDGKTWMLQGPFIINLEYETDEYYIGRDVERPLSRVWAKSEWGVAP